MQPVPPARPTVPEAQNIKAVGTLLAKARENHLASVGADTPPPDANRLATPTKAITPQLGKSRKGKEKAGPPPSPAEAAAELPPAESDDDAMAQLDADTDASADWRALVKAQNLVIHRLQDRLHAISEWVHSWDVSTESVLGKINGEQKAQRRMMAQLDNRLDDLFARVSSGHERVEQLQQTYVDRLDGYADDFYEVHHEYNEQHGKMAQALFDRADRADAAVSTWYKRLSELEEHIGIKVGERGVYTLTPAPPRPKHVEGRVGPRFRLFGGNSGEEDAPEPSAGDDKEQGASMAESATPADEEHQPAKTTQAAEDDGPGDTLSAAEPHGAGDTDVVMADGHSAPLVNIIPPTPHGTQSSTASATQSQAPSTQLLPPPPPSAQGGPPPPQFPLSPASFPTDAVSEMHSAPPVPDATSASSPGTSADPEGNASTPPPRPPQSKSKGRGKSAVRSVSPAFPPAGRRSTRLGAGGASPAPSS